MTKTLPSYFNYLEDIPLALIEHELETAQTDLKEATKDVANASSYGGFPSKLKIAKRRKSAATEALKYVKQVIKDRQYD